MPSIMFRISTSVERIPSRPIRPTLAIVSSTFSSTNPSPGWNTRCLLAICHPVSAAVTDAAIFAAQLDFAPSQTMPPAVQIVLVMVWLISS